MKWKLPHISKVYEALGAIPDGRVELLGGRVTKFEGGVMKARVYSSSRNKFYDVCYDHAKNAIMSNDNSAYWKGELGYPAIALLMQLGVLPFDKEVAESLKGIAWKDINQKNKNDFDKTVAEVLATVDSLGAPSFAKATTGKQGTKSGVTAKEVNGFCKGVLHKIKEFDLGYLGPRQKPPAGY